jgi:putative ABC transport system ATP-binding protein
MNLHGNLDSKTSKEIMDIITEIAKDNNQTIVMVTHDPSMTRYATKIIEIHDGKLVSIRKGDKDSEKA